MWLISRKLIKPRHDQPSCGSSSFGATQRLPRMNLIISVFQIHRRSFRRLCACLFVIPSMFNLIMIMTNNKNIYKWHRNICVDFHIYIWHICIYMCILKQPICHIDEHWTLWNDKMTCYFCKPSYWLTAKYTRVTPVFLISFGHLNPIIQISHPRHTPNINS